MKVFLQPRAYGVDDGQGGIRRVVEGQQDFLPKYGVQLVDKIDDADIVACHISIPPEFLKRFPEKIFVAHCHGLYWREYEWEKWTQISNREVMESLRVADVITAPSHWVASVIRRHTSRPVYAVPHGVRFSDWNTVENKGYVLWDKTRPDPVCDPHLMQEVAALLPDVHFVSTFGEPKKNVSIVGHQTFAESQKLTSEAAVYLATSRETFGIATIQALACGVPVVAYNWGAHPEILTHKVDSYLANIEDPKDLAKGILWALENRAIISKAALKTAQHYTWDNACKEYVRIFQEAIDKKAAYKAAPRTSIIVTAYKLDQYLEECLDSVLKQFDTNWECIIVDDASPDKCGEIADKYAAKDSRFKVIHNETNQYLSGARNIGIQAARGKYILPLDADDKLTPHAVRILSESLDSNRSIHIAYGNVYFVDEDGHPNDYGSTPGHSQWPVNFSWEKQISRMNLLPYCSMFRREVWDYTGGYRKRLKTTEDADFWTRVSSYGFRPKMVTEVDTLIYRCRTNSMSQTEGQYDWTIWFPWRRELQKAPAGCVSETQLSIPTYIPPVLSVIIPVGPGHEELVMDAIDSCEAQSMRQFETIVVNDSGKSLHLPQWVRYFEVENAPQGVANARNIGIRAAHGLNILPLDADDILQPNAVKIFYEFSQVNPGVILYSDFWEDPDTEGAYRRFFTDDYEASLLVSKGAIATVTALIPREVFEKIGLYDTDMIAWEDWAFMLKAAENGFCYARIPKPLFTYRKHTGRRAKDNFENKDKNKEQILAKFGHFWNGKKNIMACSKCAQGRAKSPDPIDEMNFRSQQNISPSLVGVKGEMILIEYSTERLADAQFRGPSNQRYNFANGDRKYVLAQDASFFFSMDGFKDATPLPEEDEIRPILVSSNPSKIK